MSHRPLAARGRLMSLFLAATFGALVPVLTDQGPRLVNPRPRRSKMRSSTLHKRNGARERNRRVRQMQRCKCIDPVAQLAYFRATFRPDV